MPLVSLRLAPIECLKWLQTGWTGTKEKSDWSVLNVIDRGLFQQAVFKMDTGNKSNGFGKGSIWRVRLARLINA